MSTRAVVDDSPVGDASPVVGRRKRRKQRDPRESLIVHSLQLLLLVVILAGWQWVPEIKGAKSISPVFNSFFVSSPSLVSKTLYDLATGTNMTSIWGPFQDSVVPALIGTGIAIVAGATAGLFCSNWVRLNRVLRPYVITANALPRITLIPIIIVLVGPSAEADIVIGFLVVFFLVFFNAYEGGTNIAPETIENMRILGASRWQEMRRVRFPYVVAWTFASLPNAIGFGLTAIVTAELFTGANGLGQLLLQAVNTANANLTVAVTVVLGITGLLLIGIASFIRDRVLHWW